MAEQELRRPLNPFERIGLYGYAVKTHLRYPVNGARFRIGPNPTMVEFLQAISEGKPKSKSPLEIRDIFADYQVDIKGAENIPQTGPILIVSNHSTEGPMKGMWQTFAIADAVQNNIPQGNERRFGFIMDSEKDSTGIMGKVPFVRSWHDRMMRHILSNIAATLDFIPTSHARDAIRRLIHGEIVGIFPAEAVSSLPRGKKEAGHFMELAGKIGVPILPIGAYHNPRKKDFILRIGEPVIYKNDPSNPGSEQTTVDDAMHRVALLLPPKMRGYYGKEM